MNLLSLSLAAAALAAVLPFAALPAQTVIRGRLLQDAESTPIAGGRVTLVTSEGRARHHAVTDGSGGFIFSSVTPGPFQLRASAPRFETAQTPFLEAVSNDTIDLEVRLDRATVLLAPMTVVARSRRRESPVTQGYYDRLAGGFGYFITRDDIERRNALSTTDLLLTIPGVRLGGSTMGGRRTLMMSRALRARGECPVQVFVDGFHMNRRGIQTSGQALDTTAGARLPVSTEPPYSVDDHVHPSQLEGAEVYKGMADVPAEFWTPDAACGTVVLWTRRGPRE